MDCVSEKVNKQLEVINGAEVDRLCGRNWAEDPIQGNSDLWVITCNVLRRRAVSGCLSDSISLTQRGAVHSPCLNCPICFPLMHNSFCNAFAFTQLKKQKERDGISAVVNSFTRKGKKKKSTSLLLIINYTLPILPPSHTCTHQHFTCTLYFSHTNQLTIKVTFTVHSVLYIFITYILLCHSQSAGLCLPLCCCFRAL